MTGVQTCALPISWQSAYTHTHTRSYTHTCTCLHTLSLSKDTDVYMWLYNAGLSFIGVPLKIPLLTEFHGRKRRCAPPIVWEGGGTDVAGERHEGGRKDGKKEKEEPSNNNTF